jgi:hypothetical protein
MQGVPKIGALTTLSRMFKCTYGALRYRRDYRKRQKKVKKIHIYGRLHR